MRTAEGRSRFRAVGLALLVALALGVPSPATAQLPPVPDAMEELGFLAGDWEGSGWIEWAPGQRAEFEGTETVEPRMDGRILVVEGDFSASMGPGGEQMPVHQAFGVLYHDPAAGEVRFRTWLARGPGSVHEVEVGEGRLEWGYDDPRLGRVRYTIRVTDDTWHEVGHARRDGEDWRPFFEMTLIRR